MMRTRYVLPVLAGLLILVLAACGETTSDVGLDLVSADGEPVVRELTPTMFEQSPYNDITGARPRVLAGHVNDPLVGSIHTTGYVDFTTSFDSTDTSAFNSITLRLGLDYVYGDSLAPVTLNLHDITDDWTALNTRADTTLSVGDLVTSFTFQPTDSLIVVPLPQAWIDANDATLRSTLFSVDFHGFAMEAVSQDAVVGFNFNTSDLRLITEVDTFDFALTRTLTGIERQTEATVPEGFLLLQDGAGPSLRFDFELDEFSETPLNGALLRFFADTLAVQAAPPNFVRPLLEVLEVVRVTETEQEFVVALATLTEHGDYLFTDPLVGELFQQSFFGVNLFEHLELRVPADNNTINFMLIHDASAGEMAPEALLTISP